MKCFAVFVLLSSLSLPAVAQVGELPMYQVGRLFDAPTGNFDRILLFDTGRGNKIRGSILERAFPDQPGNSIYLTKSKFFGRIQKFSNSGSKVRVRFSAKAPGVGRMNGVFDFDSEKSRKNAGQIEIVIPASERLYLPKRRKFVLRADY